MSIKSSGTMSKTLTNNATGGCPCGQVRYRVLADPLIVHCCHCRWCQRESGAAFCVNILVETTQLRLLPPSSGDAWAFRDLSAREGTKFSPTAYPAPLDSYLCPSESGNGQQLVRCNRCHIAVWSHYLEGDMGVNASFIRAGTLDDTSVVEPDVHIFTSSKQSWVSLPSDGKSVFAEYYDQNLVWSKESLQRLKQIEDLARR